MDLHPSSRLVSVVAVFLLSLCNASPLWAARPFTTDDARLTTAGSCQVESWTRQSADSREFWALPACNPSGNFEITLGAGTAKNRGEIATEDYAVQGKTLFRSLETNDWGIGLAVGMVRHTDANPNASQQGNLYAYTPLSVSLFDDKVIWHSNLGWLRDTASQRHRMTWGSGLEVNLHPRVMAIAELYGDHRSSPYGQVGARFSILPNVLQVDATVGQALRGNDKSRWVSFGLRYTPEKLF